MAPINFSGIASGLDTNALIQASLQQERATRITPLTRRSNELESTNNALGDLRAKVEKLKSASSNFRVLSGGGIAKKGASSNENVAEVRADNGSSPSSLTLSVSSLAKTGTVSFNDRFSSPSAVINGSVNDTAPAADRTLTVTTGSGIFAEQVAVEVTSTTTAEQYVTQYNSNATKSFASLVNAGTTASPSYGIVISSKQSGTDGGSLSIALGTELQSAGTLSSSTLSQATNALFSVDGVSGTISRGSNVVSDLVPGVVLQIQGVGTTSVSVTNDSQAAATSLKKLVDAYNEVVSFAKEQDQITRSGDSSGDISFGALSSTSLDEGLIGSLRSAISTARISQGGSTLSLADIGVKTERDGTLTFEEKVFKTSLESDPSRTQLLVNALGEGLAGTSTGVTSVYTRFGGVIDREVRSNQSRLDDYSKRIADAEKVLERRKESLSQQFARLESLIGSLNKQQSALSSLPK
jgi:flagellar hook-associated protein 2